MNINEIRELLPHRFPFLLVDRVIALEPYKQITAIKNVTANEHFFEGHFPGNPVMPGVLIIEAMAQAAGILGFKSLGKTPDDGSIYMFAGIDNARFKRQVVPGDQLELVVDYVADKRNIWKFSGKAFVDGELAASVDITCVDKAVT